MCVDDVSFHFDWSTRLFVARFVYAVLYFINYSECIHICVHNFIITLSWPIQVSNFITYSYKTDVFIMTYLGKT